MLHNNYANKQFIKITWYYFFMESRQYVTVFLPIRYSKREPLTLFIHGVSLFLLVWN